MSKSTWIAIEYASRSCMPDEKFLSFWSTKRSSSAKPTMSSKRCAICFRVSPSRVPLILMLSRAVSSGLKPTPSSMNGERRPLTRTTPALLAVDAGDDLEQRALAAAVRPDYAEELARFDCKGDVFQRLLALVGRAAKRVEEVLLEIRPLLVRQPKGLADASHVDRRHGCRAHARSANHGSSRRKKR